MSEHSIDHSSLTIDQLQQISTSNAQISLSAAAQQAILKGRHYLESTLEKSDAAIYGINTGFGALCDVKIDRSELEQLQQNLVMSHACGSGDLVPLEICKRMLLLKIQSLSLGYSGVRLELVQRLVDMYNAEIIPVIFQQGSLGASGDLAPLAHLSLPLMGMGDVYVNGVQRSASEALEMMGWEPLTLQSKEGLALLNGTQFMNAYGVSLAIEAKRLINWAVAIAAISCDGYDARPEPFFPQLHEIRNHLGQKEIAHMMRTWLKDSSIHAAEKVHVQDPYSFRCIPQVLGASLDTLNYVCSVFEREANAVTDNPTVFPDDDMIISGGNFHGQPLALALDFLCLAMHEVGSISERRTYQLIGGKRGLPPFLVAKPGLNSGLMIPQYTAASVVSQNKHLCMPASADTIDSSNGQEDHVSMGANAATKAWRVKENLETILSIELLNATQALEFRRPSRSSSALEEIVSAYRKLVPFVENDRIMHTEIEKGKRFMRDYSLPSR